MPLTLDTPAHRFLEQYAKQYHAGAFATPTAAEIERNYYRVADVRYAEDRTVVASRTLTRDSIRTDFTGSKYQLPAGARVATHVARTPGVYPGLADYDYIMTYAEDLDLCAALAVSGRHVQFTRVSAAAEIIHCWGARGGGYPGVYAPWDRATVVDMGYPVTHVDRRTAILRELHGVTGWDDDFPYYSDGSWSALSLKGYWPDDPGRGIKPSEMPRSWKAEHAEDLERTCEWTALADKLPTLIDHVQSIFGTSGHERVRLLRMSRGKLGRHTDITDRFSGTRDGEIVRFHIPLITHPDIQLSTWDLDGRRRDTHLAAWDCYYLDARKPHAVTNPTAVDRIHLVVDYEACGPIRRALSARFAQQQEAEALP